MKFKLLALILLSTTHLVKAQSGTPIPVDSSYSVRNVYNQIKKDFPYASPAQDQRSAGLREYRDVVYAKLAQTPFGARDLHLDLFRPADSEKYPALIMVHGGGWRSGNKSMQIPLAQMLAGRGFVTIPVEYQLSLEAKYPAAVHNIKAAIRWVRANAARYNIDTSKIAISGCSAGGQLASLVGMTNGLSRLEGKMGDANSFSSAVHAIIDIDGVISFLAPSSLNLTRNKDTWDAFWFGGLYEEKPEIWKEASAGYWVNENTVPILFLNSGYSRFHAGQDELVAQMNEFGIYNEVHRFNVKVHPFWLFHPWVDETVNYMDEFMKKIFRVKK